MASTPGLKLPLLFFFLLFNVINQVPAPNIKNDKEEFDKVEAWLRSHLILFLLLLFLFYFAFVVYNICLVFI